MSKMTERVAYLKGMAEGMKLDVEKDSNKLIMGTLDLLDDMAAALEELTEAHNDLTDYIEAIDEDLAEVEDVLMADDDEEDDDEDFNDVEILTYNCPHCGCEIEFDADDVDFDEDYVCPVCGKKVFPENFDDEDTEE